MRRCCRPPLVFWWNIWRRECNFHITGRSDGFYLSSMLSPSSGIGTAFGCMLQGSVEPAEVLDAEPCSLNNLGSPFAQLYSSTLMPISRHHEFHSNRT